jgi:hypothetical protein
MASSPQKIEETEVVLHLLIEVAPEDRSLLLDFCRKAFPVYESIGGLRMALYADARDPNRFDEVGYYRSMDDYRRSEAALDADPEHAALIREWRALLKGPPAVSLFTRQPPLHSLP